MSGAGPLVAALAAAAAAALAIGPSPAWLAGPAAPRLGAVVLAAVTVTGGALATGPGRVLPALLVAAVVWSGWALWQRRRRRRGQRAVAARVYEACEQLAAELKAGQPTGAALDRVAESWPLLAPVAEAARVGADVPAALRAAARYPGAGDLRLLAAAWQVAHRTGQGLASAVDRVAVDLLAARSTRRLVDSELSSARATARLVGGLPVLAWVMGSGAGGDPVSFLVGTPLGLACLASGSAFGLAGWWWIESIAGDIDGSA